MACVEASGWEARQRTSVVEVGKEDVSHGGEVARVKASAWETGEGAVPVEAVEEVDSYCPTDITCVEASSWEGGQFSSLVEGGEKAVSYGGDLTRVEASTWEAR